MADNTTKNPPIDVPAVDPTTGCWVPVQFDRQKRLDALQPLSDIPAEPSFSVTAVTVGNTTTSITNRTVTDAGNGGLTGTDTSILGVGTSPNPQQNGWTTLMNVVNSFNTNHINHKNAADALNTRVRALETKLNAIIADLDARFP